MRLEEEIYQQKFESVFHKLHLNLNYTNNWLREKESQLFRQFGITPQQYNVLRILRGNYPNPYSTAQIRERMLDKLSDASRIVDRLLRKGLVERKVCPADKRLVDIIVSKQGLVLLSKMEESIQMSSALLKNLSTEEAVLVNQLLDVDGRTLRVFEWEHTQGNFLKTVTLKLEPGIYLLELSTETGKIIKRVVSH